MVSFYYFYVYCHKIVTDGQILVFEYSYFASESDVARALGEIVLALGI